MDSNDPAGFEPVDPGFPDGGGSPDSADPDAVPNPAFDRIVAVAWRVAQGLFALSVVWLGVVASRIQSDPQAVIPFRLPVDRLPFGGDLLGMPLPIALGFLSSGLAGSLLQFLRVTSGRKAAPTLLFAVDTIVTLAWFGLFSLTG